MAFFKMVDLDGRAVTINTDYIRKVTTFKTKIVIAYDNGETETLKDDQGRALIEFLESVGKKPNVV